MFLGSLSPAWRTLIVKVLRSENPEMKHRSLRWIAAILLWSTLGHSGKDLWTRNKTLPAVADETLSLENCWQEWQRARCRPGFFRQVNLKRMTTT
jgi:hypothetical protein